MNTRFTPERVQRVVGGERRGGRALAGRVNGLRIRTVCTLVNTAIFHGINFNKICKYYYFSGFRLPVSSKALPFKTGTNQLANSACVLNVYFELAFAQYCLRSERRLENPIFLLFPVKE